MQGSFGQNPVAAGGGATEIHPQSYAAIYSAVSNVGANLRKHKRSLAKHLPVANQELETLLATLKQQTMHNESPSSRVAEAQILMNRAVVFKHQSMVALSSANGDVSQDSDERKPLSQSEARAGVRAFSEEEAKCYLDAAMLWIAIEKERRLLNMATNDDALIRGIVCFAMACSVLLSVPVEHHTNPIPRTIQQHAAAAAAAGTGSSSSTTASTAHHSSTANRKPDAAAADKQLLQHQDELVRSVALLGPQPQPFVVNVWEACMKASHVLSDFQCFEMAADYAELAAVVVLSAQSSHARNNGLGAAGGGGSSGRSGGASNSSLSGAAYDGSSNSSFVRGGVTSNTSFASGAGAGGRGPAHHGRTASFGSTSAAGSSVTPTAPFPQGGPQSSPSSLSIPVSVSGSRQHSPTGVASSVGGAGTKPMLLRQRQQAKLLVQQQQQQILQQQQQHQEKEKESEVHVDPTADPGTEAVAVTPVGNPEVGSTEVEEQPSQEEEVAESKSPAESLDNTQKGSVGKADDCSATASDGQTKEEKEHADDSQVSTPTAGTVERHPLEEVGGEAQKVVPASPPARLSLSASAAQFAPPQNSVNSYTATSPTATSAAAAGVEGSGSGDKAASETGREDASSSIAAGSQGAGSGSQPGGSAAGGATSSEQQPQQSHQQPTPAPPPTSVIRGFLGNFALAVERSAQYAALVGDYERAGILLQELLRVLDQEEAALLVDVSTDAVDGSGSDPFPDGSTVIERGQSHQDSNLPVQQSAGATATTTTSTAGSNTPPPSVSGDSSSAAAVATRSTTTAAITTTSVNQRKRANSKAARERGSKCDDIGAISGSSFAGPSTSTPGSSVTSRTTTGLTATASSPTAAAAGSTAATAVVSSSGSANDNNSASEAPADRHYSFRVGSEGAFIRSHVLMFLFAVLAGDTTSTKSSKPKESTNATRDLDDDLDHDDGEPPTSSAQSHILAIHELSALYRHYDRGGTNFSANTSKVSEKMMPACVKLEKAARCKLALRQSRGDKNKEPAVTSGSAIKKLKCSTLHDYSTIIRDLAVALETIMDLEESFGSGAGAGAAQVSSPTAAQHTDNTPHSPTGGPGGQQKEQPQDHEGTSNKSCQSTTTRFAYWSVAGHRRLLESAVHDVDALLGTLGIRTRNLRVVLRRAANAILVKGEPRIVM